MKQKIVAFGKWMTQHKIITIAVAVLMALIIVFSCLGALVFNRFSQGYTPDAEDLANAKVYEHVVIFGVDGAGGYFEECDTPNFDRIYKNGNSSVTYKGMSQYPTISAQNWTSMMHGVRCQKHGITNDIAASTPYTDTKYPSFFKVYSERHPEATYLSVCNWAAINVGIVEDNITGMTKINASELQEKDVKYECWEQDKLVCDKIVEELSRPDYEPTVVFMQFDSVDHAGHEDGAGGYGSPLFTESLIRVDGYIGQIYDACVAKGWENNTLFITVSDHGHDTVKSGGHGANQYHVRYTTFAAMGKLGNIVDGKTGYYVTQDVASVVMYALGEAQPDSWESKVPKNLFNTIK